MYLILDTEQDAKDRSAEAWEQRLGRAKNPEDITEFLWSWETGKDGRSVLVIGKEEFRLTPQEEVAQIEVLPEGKGENWEKPDPSIIDVGQLEA